MTIGRAVSSELELSDDSTVSRLHALLESYGPAWVIRDLGSSNGTFVNGERVLGDVPLQPGDEIRVGNSRLVFRAREGVDPGGTLRVEGPPSLTRREQDVLIALCRPLMGGEAFNEPASIKQLADELFVSEAAIKFHLGNLYDKFGIYDTSHSRRVALANEAMRRGAVKRTDLRPRKSDIP
jgi:pSer/pThr/pTyr-binding forkhead associated (FHA) protein